MTPIFKNKPNNVHIIKGKEVWESRSVAVVVVVLVKCRNEIYTLGEKRSMIMADAPGKWVVPGGYMDYNESGWDCVCRELFEETSFNINNYNTDILFDNYKQPFFVKTEPDENRQNIVLNYCVVFKLENLPKEIYTYHDKEIEKLDWILTKNIDLPKYKWAFNHNLRIKMALTKYNSVKWKLKLKRILKKLRTLITRVK